MLNVLEQYAQGTLDVKVISQQYPDLLVDLSALVDNSDLWGLFPRIKKDRALEIELEIYLENYAVNILSEIDKSHFTEIFSFDFLIEFIAKSSYRHVGFTGPLLEFLEIKLKPTLNLSQRILINKNKNRIARLCSNKPYVDYKKEDKILPDIWSKLPNEIVFLSIGRFISLPTLEMLRKQHPYWDITFKNRMLESPVERRAYARLTDQPQLYGPMYVPKNIIDEAYHLEYLINSRRPRFLDNFVASVDDLVLREVMKNIPMSLVVDTLLVCSKDTATKILQCTHDLFANSLNICSRISRRKIILLKEILEQLEFPNKEFIMLGFEIIGIIV